MTSWAAPLRAEVERWGIVHSRVTAWKTVVSKTGNCFLTSPKYHPIERCWGILELHWNGTKLVDFETMLEWAKSMTWKGIRPIVELSRKVYQKGGALSK